MSSRFVTLARFDSAAEAHLALNLLEGEGIEARIGNEDANALQLGPALGGVRLLVPQEQAEKAAHLLDSMLGAYQDMELPEPAAEPTTRRLWASSSSLRSTIPSTCLPSSASAVRN